MPTSGSRSQISANSAYWSSDSFCGDAATSVCQEVSERYLPTCCHQSSLLHALPPHPSHLFLSTAQAQQPQNTCQPSPHRFYLERLTPYLPNPPPLGHTGSSTDAGLPCTSHQLTLSFTGMMCAFLLHDQDHFQNSTSICPKFCKSSCSFLSSIADHNNKQVHSLLLILKVGKWTGQRITLVKVSSSTTPRALQGGLGATGPPLTEI